MNANFHPNETVVILGFIFLSLIVAYNIVKFIIKTIKR